MIPGALRGPANSLQKPLLLQRRCHRSNRLVRHLLVIHRAAPVLREELARFRAVGWQCIPLWRAGWNSAKERVAFRLARGQGWVIRLQAGESEEASDEESVCSEAFPPEANLRSPR